MAHHDPHLIARILSGGQTGADRGALDGAIASTAEYGGWCPAGGWAEDLPEPPGLLLLYPRLRETDAADPAVRTSRNVRDGDATLVVIGSGTTSPGSDLTRRTALALARPLLVTDGTDVGGVTSWLSALGAGLTLNVAGPRASEEPGIYDRTRRLVEALLSRAAGST